MATFSPNVKFMLAEKGSSFPTPSSSSLLPRIKCSSDLPGRDTEPSSERFLKTLAKPLAVLSLSLASVAAASAFLLRGGGGGGGGGGFGCGGGDGDDGGFWGRLFSAAPAVDDEDWDSHRLPPNITLQRNKLIPLSKYKVSDITFFDRRSQTTVGTEYSLSEMVSIREGGVYTKAQLKKVVETLATCGLFEKVDFKAKTKPDGSLGVTFSFAENTWPSPESFRCVNIGLMNEQERPCLLPSAVHREVMKMLRDQEKISGRMLLRVRERVNNWYDDKGYVGAQLVNFKSLDTKELVCEVLEGDITQMVIQIQDELGNVVEDSKNVSLVLNKLPKQLRQGYAFNIEDRKQALKNIRSLGLFTSIEVEPRPDEKNEGCVVVEIKLKEKGRPK